MIKLLLPFPPSTNTYWRNVSGRVLISAKGREYRQKVMWALTEQLKGRWATFTGPVEVNMVLYPPDRRARDIDNFNKALFDSLTKYCVWVDDKLIKRLIIEWADPKKGGLVDIEIKDYVK